MKKQIWLLANVFIFIVLFAPITLLASPYYEGKKITIIVGFETGGGYDRLARVLARHLPKSIPGKPTIIVENMPGASSKIAANHVYNLAKPDGLTIATLDRGLPFAQLMKAGGIKFDLTKFAWIGSAAVESTILALRTDLPYKTIDDLRKAKDPIHLASLGPASSDYQFPTLLKEFIGLNLKIVIYSSTQVGMLAVERKEVEGKAGSYTALKPFIERGLIHPLIRCRVSQPGIESLPVNEDLTTDKKGKIIMSMLASGDQMGRPFVAPPGTPPDIMNLLRDAFANVAKDPELKEDVKKNMLEVEYVPADECLKILNYLLTQPEDIVKEFGKYVKF